MKTKCLAVGIILVFVGICIIPSTGKNVENSQVASRGDWLYVGGSGLGNYSRIQDAIENASAGDTIFVYHGWYTEHDLFISKMNLIGEDRNTTFVCGAGIYSGGIHLGEGSTLSGFTINSFTKYSITTGPGTGVFIDGNNVTISNNIITACTQGIFFKEDCSQIEVSDNVIKYNQYYGIYLQRAACSIHDNLFISNHNFAIDVMVGTREVSIDHNHFEDNDVGIWVRSAGATISRNNFIANDEDIWLTWETTLLTLPFVFYRTPSFRENYCDDWPGSRPQVIHGYFRFWISIPSIGSMLVFHLPIIQFNWHPAQEPYDIPGGWKNG